MDLFSDPSIDLILCSIGGFNSNGILPFLDYAFIAEHPKIFIGHSDATALLLALYARAGLITFHGPALLPQWGESPQPFSYTSQCFLDVTRNVISGMIYRRPEWWTDERISWDTDFAPQSRSQFRSSGWTCLRAGRATGILLGGNLETLNSIVGTPYCPEFENALLFVEATGEEAELPRLDRALQHLELAGLMDGIRGIAAGRCPDAKPEQGLELADVLRRYGERHNVPVAADLDFGHTDPMMTLPIGVQAEMACNDQGVKLRLLSPAVFGPTAD